MYRIRKSFEFCGAHKLIAPYEGPCSKMHGHTWKVEIEITSEMLDECGMVADFYSLEPFRLYLAQRFDHCTINNTVKQPTAENIARHLSDWAAAFWNVKVVRVWESDTACAEYSRA